MGELARREAANDGAQWVAAAHTDPEQVWREWNQPLAVALVPAGREWDAVAMPYARWQAVEWDMGSGAWINTPVLADETTGQVYLFVPVGTAKNWSEPGTTALGEGSWLVVSKPGGRFRRAVGAWIQPPGLMTRLTDPDQLRASLRHTADCQEDSQ
ncbi:hypothetical protein [Streptomyces sp. CB03238]|uniref:hypothetical protein n=1 Tax=Streptomyces sp. CB03238 TaxID=1907777 RepID=UPI000A121A92|nr:hypothetical protein [Streptomyces sp. CB03238]ORT54211.1 hypothetical protein BKD26_36075 [Streptomyces sp. CB03238]